MSEWISVKDRVPEDMQSVWVYCSNNIEIECEKYNSDMYVDGQWVYCYDVTHWMPLPKPPEENHNA